MKDKCDEIIIPKSYFDRIVESVEREDKTPTEAMIKFYKRAILRRETMKFIDEVKSLDELQEKVAQTLTSFCRSVSDIAEKYNDNGSGVFELGCDESYESHRIIENENTIKIVLSYKDPYDEICDSTSTYVYPLKWLEAFTSDKGLDEVGKDIQEKVEKVVSLENDRQIRNLKRQAEYLGYKLVKRS